MKTLHAKGPDAVVDINHALLSETMDVIGFFGFRQNFNTIRRVLSVCADDLTCTWPPRDTFVLILPMQSRSLTLHISTAGVGAIGVY